MKKAHFVFIALLSIALSNPIFAQEIFTTGPENGSLVVVGGGRMDDSIVEKFIELAGGLDAPIVVIPTAGGANSYTENSGGARAFREFGATNVTVLHTYDKNEANTDEFIKPLKEAKGVFFGGGRQWRLVDAYAGTKTETAFWEVLERGGVVGGSSAGATIQGSYLARGDTRTNQTMMGDHEEGFGFIKNIAIDQHVIARNRHFDMFDILKNRPELLGISVDESTAVVVQGNEFEVIGRSYVIIYDGSFWSREGSDLKTLPSEENLFYFLRSGDKYNMKERKVID
ncbi:MAG: cyanophycinase [Balneolaceae bacterium]